jgi:hypothetical protein
MESVSEVDRQSFVTKVDHKTEAKEDSFDVPLSLMGFGGGFENRLSA